MATMIPLSSIKRIRPSKTPGWSLSKPTIKPPCTIIPLSWIFLIDATRSLLIFWVLLHSARLASFGDSIPKKTDLKPALTMDSIRSSSSAILTEASVVKVKGYLWSCIQVLMAGRISSFSFFLLPIKLSSTKKTPPRQPLL